MRERLAPGGIYVQWAPSQRAAETFATVFPHTLLLMPVAVLIGSNDPIPFDAERLAEALEAPATAEHLRRGNPDFHDWRLLCSPIRRWSWGPGTPRRERTADRHLPARRILHEQPGHHDRRLCAAHRAGHGARPAPPLRAFEHRPAP